MNTWVDEKTGRTVRQLTSQPGGARVPYFRQPRSLPDGRLLVHAKHERGSLLFVDPETGDAQPLASEPGQLIRFRETDGVGWFHSSDSRELCQMTLPDGATNVFMGLPGAGDQLDLPPVQPGLGQRGPRGHHAVFGEVPTPFSPRVHARTQDVQRFGCAHAILHAYTVRSTPASSV